MGLHKKNILSIGITIDSKKTILEYIQKYLHSVESAQKNPCVITTPNPEQIVMAQQQKVFSEILNRADVALPDGVGVVWALKKIYGLSSVVRYSGVDALMDIAGLAEKERVRIGLIGGNAGLAVDALECLRQEYPRLAGWGDDLGEISADETGALTPRITVSRVASRIRSTRTRVVFVGLGAPKQEYMIEALRQELAGYPCVYVSVGGSFALMAGSLRRAPLFIRSIGFEWFWRLVQEPWRWKRQLALFEYVWLVLRHT